MAKKRLSMRQIRQVLRLKYEHGLPNRAIAKACSVGVATVAEYLGRARRAALSWPLPEDLDDEALEARLFPLPEQPGAPRPLPSFTHVHQDSSAPV